jgi:hypothetical protein
MRKGVPALICLLVVFAFSFGVSSARAESTIACPAGTYDMLDWMTMDSGLRGSYHMAGNANPLYTNMASGKFYWAKASNGFPWDIQLFDSSYVYLWITELNWTDPHTFKKFVGKNEPLVPRCAKAGFPGSTIKVPNTSYQTYSDCTHYVTQNLKQGINQVWGPYWISLGGNLPSSLKVLVASYRYNCDSNYANCGDKEEYYLAQKYGLVQWVHYSLSSGSYVMKQKTIFNQLKAGATTPVFVCF